jgi:hypothetical protein
VGDEKFLLCLTLYFRETLQFIIKSCYKSCLFKLYPTYIFIMDAQGLRKSFSIRGIRLVQRHQ